MDIQIFITSPNLPAKDHLVSALRQFFIHYSGREPFDIVCRSYAHEDTPESASFVEFEWTASLEERT